ncbi:MAG: thiol:disulfide interchange protein DsbA/DsbL [Gammaproteobacteria bacterium]|nr:thiol:disulfide interchange protein DsbA/DsbL [Gammaproteobacteria bacterium]
MHSWFAVVLTAIFAISTGPALAAEYDEGIEYKLIDPPLRATPENGRVEVAELFWYGCPHCFHLEPEVKAWLARKPAAADFLRVPAPLNPAWAVHSRAYYAAEALGVLDKTHEALFSAIHEDKRPIMSDAALAEFYAQHGVDAAEYLTMARSFGIATKVRRAATLGNQWKARGVPAFVVNGKYLVNVESAGGPRKLFDVIDYLVAREAAALPATDAAAPAAAPATTGGGTN